MKRTLAAMAVGLTVFAGNVAARHGDYADTAKVISATPIYETVRVSRPVEECWTERRVQPAGGSGRAAGTLAGGIVGGLIGNQFGHGSGRAAMTVAGTLIGASVGHELSRDVRPARVVREERCERVGRYRSEERLVGYRVEYRYQGRTFVTRTDEHPGRRIPVRVAVEPVRSY
jgi:uncharacterized protein YcfJ